MGIILVDVGCWVVEVGVALVVSSLVDASVVGSTDVGWTVSVTTTSLVVVTGAGWTVVVIGEGAGGGSVCTPMK